MKAKVIYLVFTIVPILLHGQEKKEEIELLKSNVKKVIYNSYKSPINHENGWKYSYNISKFGKILSYDIEFKGERIGTYFYEYDSNNLEKIERYIPSRKTDSGNIEHIYKWSYDTDSIGRIIKEKEYYDSSISYPSVIKENFNYDINGNILSYEIVRFANRDKAKIMKTKYIQFYSKNMLISRLIINGSDSLFTFFKYDSHGMIKSIFSKSKSKYYQKLYNSNESKLITKVDSSEYKFRYVHDRRGNWIKRFVTYNGKEYLNDKRKILYY